MPIISTTKITTFLQKQRNASKRLDISFPYIICVTHPLMQQFRPSQQDRQRRYPTWFLLAHLNRCIRDVRIRRNPHPMEGSIFLGIPSLCFQNNILRWHSHGLQECLHPLRIPFHGHRILTFDDGTIRCQHQFPDTSLLVETDPLQHSVRNVTEFNAVPFPVPVAVPT